MEYLTHALAFWLGASFAVSEFVRIGGHSGQHPLVVLLLSVLFWPFLLYFANKKIKEKELSSGKD